MYQMPKKIFDVPLLKKSHPRICPAETSSPQQFTKAINLVSKATSTLLTGAVRRDGVKDGAIF